MPLRVAIATRNAELDALSTLLDNGYLRIYTGAQPATPETAVSGTLLAELRFNADAFPAASGGVLTANAITPDTVADNTGTAGYARALKSDGSTAVLDTSVTVTGGGGPLELDSVAIQSGADVVVDSFTLTLPT
jgi:hypothetical protein